MVRRRRGGRGRAGFSLTELLVTLAVIGLLAAVLLPTLSKATQLARRAACLSNLRQIGVATGLYLGEHDERMPWVPDTELQFTPPVNSSGKRYNSMGSFLPLLHPYAPDVRIWESPPARTRDTNRWQAHFNSPWRESGRDQPARGWANYLSDKLAELDPEQPRYLRGRTPLSCAIRRGTSVSAEEWLMSPFFEKSWWPGFHAQWSRGESVPPRGGWSAHNGGRNQLYLDLHADWVRRDIDR